jgi:hypothetical protein
VHVDSNAGKAAVMDSTLLEKLEKIRASQAGLAPRPQQGRRIAMSMS